MECEDSKILCEMLADRGYEILEPLSSDKYTRSFLASSSRHSCKVILKHYQVATEDVAFMRKELRLLTKVSCPFVARVLDRFQW